MKYVRTPSDPGQTTHQSSSSSLDPRELLAEFHALRREVERALPRLQLAIERIEAKLVTSGLDVADMAEPPPPPFALLTDGRLLLSTSVLSDRELGKRDVWSGVVLSPSDVAFVLGRTENAAHETACHLVTQYPRKGEPPDADNDGDDTDSDDDEGGDNE